MYFYMYLQVLAMDCNGSSADILETRTKLNITLEDINDHAPVFLSGHYNFSVNEGTAPNTYLGTVHAQDRDLGVNALIRYSIISGSQAKFYIDRISGKLL